MRCMHIWQIRVVACVFALVMAGGRPAWLRAEDAVQPEVKVLADLPYRAGEQLDAYEQERGKLDVYLPTGTTGSNGFPTLVWFYGGGLTAGNKADVKPLAMSLARAGVAVVTPDYRLSPRAKYPAYVEDAAAAFAWTHRNIARLGGKPELVFIGGHSAGGYLALMVSLDSHYLEAERLGLDAIAGVLPVSGQVMTHYTVRAERGLAQTTITADAAAPVFYCRKETPPMLVLYADHDMPARAEENQYFVAVMHWAGNQGVTGKLITDRDHGSIASRIADEGDPAREAMLEFIKEHGGMKKAE
jgi:acetyl esterase/lipase